MATHVQVKQDWDNDGWLRITGAETIKRYEELNDRASKLPLNDWGIFFAFSRKQFDEGYQGLIQKGLIKDGDKVFNFGQGAYGVREGFDRWMEELEDTDRKIVAECDPYEVYLYEYNNYECCIDYDGDERAVAHVMRLFGLERTREALEGKRFRSCGALDGIWAKIHKN